MQRQDPVTQAKLMENVRRLASEIEEEAFVSLPYWNREFVGAGPYRITQWVQDQYAVLDAFDGFALGRPRIDQIEVKFLVDLRADLLRVQIDEKSFRQHQDFFSASCDTLEKRLPLRHIRQIERHTFEAPPNYGPDYTRRFHDVYQIIAKQDGLVLMPFLLDAVAGRTALNQPDGVHPNLAGERIVAANVWKTLEPLVRELKPS